MNENRLTLSFLDSAEVSVHLKPGEMLVTASAPLAADWKRRLVSAANYEVCETPKVLSWQGWMNELIIAQDAMPVPLNRMQESWLWEKVIRADMKQLDLKQSDISSQSAASVRGLAGHAREAYALMQEYCIDAGELSCAGEEADALRRWIGAVHKKLGEGDLCGRMLAADVGNQLMRHTNEKNITQKSKSIILDGFYVFSPMQKALLAALQASGVSLAQVKSSSISTENTLYACSDVQAECHHIATRIKAVLNDAPHARIAITTSDVVSNVLGLKRALNDVLMPEMHIDPSNAMQAVAMAGEPLTDSPMIRQLLHMLSLSGEFSLSFDEFSVLLFSPWLKGHEAEYFDRARLEAVFRQHNRHRMTFKSLLNSAYVQALPELSAVLKALVGWNKNKRSAHDWVKAVHELLKITGFVRLSSDKTDSDKTGSDHEVQRSNHEIRQMNAFREVLISLVAVDAVGDISTGSRLTWMQFLSLLRTGCSEVRLAEKAKYANVVVMPLTQISGLRFDHVFVMGLDEEAFPPSARPYPLLPASVQKKYALPMSNGTLVYASSQTLWKAAQQSAPYIEISWAGQRDNKVLLASSFVADMEVQIALAATIEMETVVMEAMDDVSYVPLAAGQQVKGGASIIRNQSACPFRAFANHRLGITVLGETSPGIEASSKGSLIHLALEYVWKELGRQSALKALIEVEMVALIDAAIEYAWTEGRVTADSRTRAYEKKRMQSVLLEWLALELQRPDFRVVAIEQAYRIQLPELSENQFEVNIKADRMDVDAAGRNVLIDYKTGAKQSTSKWLPHANDGRIEEPQLPQYALAAGLGADDAVAFARVRSGDMAYEGLCGDDIGIKGIVACDGKRGGPDDWQGVLDGWRININALAMEFIEGRCEVSPRDHNACNYCGLEAVCRIEETSIDDACDEI